MLITPIDLQDEPLLFHEEIAPGTIDYAVDTLQVGPLPVEGKADLILEHRGPQDLVEDIRVRASYKGRSKSSAPAASNPSPCRSQATSTCSSGPKRPTPRPASAPSPKMRPK